MRIITLSLFIGIIALVVTPQALLFTPSVRVQSGMVTISASQSQVELIESMSDRIVTVHFSAESAAIEFFIIHSDLYNLAGLPDVALCEFHTIAKSATYQFRVDSSDTWYLVFANSPQTQEVTYEWSEYTLAEWNTRLAINWAIILGCVVIASIGIIKFTRNRVSK